MEKEYPDWIQDWFQHGDKDGLKSLYVLNRAAVEQVRDAELKNTQREQQADLLDMGNLRSKQEWHSDSRGNKVTQEYRLHRRSPFLFTKEERHPSEADSTQDRQNVAQESGW